MRNLLKRNQSGITLIALVITIIVLLILAGVSIAMLTGENGVLTQVQNSKTNSEIADEKEQIALAYNAAKIVALGEDITAAGLNTEFSTNKVNATASGSNLIKVLFNDSRREYTVDSKGKITGPAEDGNVEVGEAPVIEKIVYTKNGNTFNLNTLAYEVEPLEEQYIGDLELADGVTFGFELKEDGTIISENIENIENISGEPVADSYIKVDLTNVEEDVLVNLEITISSWGMGLINVTDSAENILMGMPEILVTEQTTETHTLNLEAGKENYIHFAYIYAGKFEANGITDSLTISKLEMNKKKTSGLTYKYTVNGKEQAANVINMDATKLQGQAEVKVGDVVESPKVPAGFRHIEGTKDEGYVISDIDQNYTVEVEVTNSVGKTARETKEITGNEFVWVPVDNFEEFKREHYGTADQKWWKGDFVTDGLSADSIYEPVSDGIKNTTEVEKMYKSVKDNGGFYIGRYEAGNEGGTYAAREWDDKGQLVVKKNTQVYNYIAWADTDDMTDETGGAVELARGFAEANEYETVQSTLVYGVQWDAVMRWISKDNALKGYLTDSTGKGNHYDEDDTNDPAKTGSNDNYKMKNIYDMAGNVYELTMESNHTLNRVSRGGSSSSKGDSSPVSYRTVYGYPSYRNFFLGFRVALYIDV